PDNCDELHQPNSQQPQEAESTKMAQFAQNVMINEQEMFIVVINRKIPLQHLNLIVNIDQFLDKCIKTKFDDICNILELTYHVKYEPGLIQTIPNLIKREGKIFDLFTCENINETISKYSNNPRFLTQASKHDTDSAELKNQILLERRVFENTWLIYGTALFTFFSSTKSHLEIPLNISNREDDDFYGNEEVFQIDDDAEDSWSSFS
ncbi:unnamed protein product, partial [Didymodactylos carnosus]